LCSPAASFVVVYFATPAPRATVFSLVPSLKVTLPMGVPVNCGFTVAVKVTDCSAFEGWASAVAQNFAS